MNADQAQTALDVARKHYNAGNYPSGIRFVKKSITLHSTPEAVALLAKLERDNDAAAQESDSSTPQASTSGTQPHPSASTTHARHAKAAAAASTTSKPAEKDKPREFTPAQAALVKRVKACKVTQYYEILGIEKDCTDNDIKKAYRKLALGLHPDKCGAPGAEEAFKMVSKAFQVLSDGNKRAIFDQTGGDPDVRGGGGGGGFSRANGGMNGFGGGGGGEEMSPEDLFRFFFNQGGGGFGGGGPFGGGGGSPFGGGTFQFYGPGGVRMSAGGPRRQQAGRGQQQQQQQQGSVWLQLAPLLILFLFSLLTQLPSLFSGGVADPSFSFERVPKYSVQRTTSNMNVDYFVNPPEFAHHPIYDAYVRENPHLGFESTHTPGSVAYKRDLERFIRLPPRVRETGSTHTHRVKIPKELAQFEKTVERSYVHRLQAICRQELQHRSDRLDRARGFLGFGANWDEIRKITAEKLPRCSELSAMGYNVQYD